MTRVLAAQAAGEVDVAAAVDVLDAGSLGAGDDDRRSGDPARDVALAGRQHPFRGRALLDGHRGGFSHVLQSAGDRRHRRSWNDRAQRRRLSRRVGGGRGAAGLPARRPGARGCPRQRIACAGSRRRGRRRQLRRLPAQPGRHGRRACCGQPLRRPRRALPRDEAPARARRGVPRSRLDRDPGPGLGSRQDEPPGERRRAATRRRADLDGDLGGHARPGCGRPSVPRALLGADAARRASDAAGDRGRRGADRGRAALGRGGARVPGAGRARDRGSTRSTPSWRRCRRASRACARRASGCVSVPGCSRSCSRSRRASCPSPTSSRRSRSLSTRSSWRRTGPESSGRRVTRGGSAKSTSEPAARAALEIAEGRLSAPGVKPPELAIEEPEAFLGLLSTEVRWRSS